MIRDLSLYWDRLLTFYGLRTPYHPGKWRVIRMLENKPKGSWTQPRLFRFHGSMYELDLNNKFERRVFYLNYLDRSETRFLEKTIRTGWTALDVGANIGFYTLLLSRLVGDRGRVYAFEPDSCNLSRLKRNIELNNERNVKVHHTAIGQLSGQVSLVSPFQDSPQEVRVALAGERATQTVPLTTVDEVIGEEGLDQVDFIKVDVEGFEVNVINGARETLRRFRPKMMIEVHPSILRQFGSSIDEFSRMVRGMGYALYHQGMRGRLLPLNELPTKWTNVIAIAG